MLHWHHYRHSGSYPSKLQRAGPGKRVAPPPCPFGFVAFAVGARLFTGAEGLGLMEDTWLKARRGQRHPQPIRLLFRNLRSHSLCVRSRFPRWSRPPSAAPTRPRFPRGCAARPSTVISSCQHRAGAGTGAHVMLPVCWQLSGAAQCTACPAAEPCPPQERDHWWENRNAPLSPTPK